MIQQIHPRGVIWVPKKNDNLVVQYENVHASSYSRTTDTRDTMAKSLIQTILNEYLGFGYKGLVFCRHNG
jgi:hypothetical protein